jgi:ketosteroid isomerase-like protein
MPDTVKQVGEAFVAALQNGDEAAAQAFWSDDIVSVEAMEGPMRELKGRAAVQGKGEWWYANNEVHDVKTKGPFVNGDQFAVEFYMDITGKADGQRVQMHEVGLYTVKDGKIVEERFFY